MSKAKKIIYRFAIQFIKIISLILSAVLFVCGFLKTCYAEDMTTQIVLTKWDNIITSLLGTGLFALIAWMLFKWVQKNPKKRKKMLLLITCGWYVIMGSILVLFSKTVPAADALSVYYAAQDLSVGNMSVIQATDSYLSYYPQQIGLVAYFEIIIRIWNLLPFNLQAYHMLKCINLIWVCTLICFQYKTVQLLFHNNCADVIYLLILLFNWPLLMYTSFVYGEIPAFSLFSIGLWGLLQLMNQLHQKNLNVPERRLPDIHMWLKPAIISLLGFIGAMALRKNTLILMIAVILVTSAEAVWQKDRLLLCMAGCYLIVACCTLPAITSFYEYRADGRLLSGVTPMSYIAMGMQESSRADGWYNGFNFETYQAAGMDSNAADQISREAIAERFAYFRQHPGYTISFYSNKFLSQWVDGTYASRQATLATYGGRTAFFQQLYEGNYSKYYISFCNILQNVLYSGAFIFCIISIKSKTAMDFCQLPLYLCLIGVIGGFLFHMLWEANARYIFPYSLLLLPYASYGVSYLLTLLNVPPQTKRQM